MRVLTVPGLGGSGLRHWQTIWEERHGYTRVLQESFDYPNLTGWLSRLTAAVELSDEPAVLVGHSLGCALIAHYARRVAPGRVAGALLVAPADIDDPVRTPWVTHCFAPLPLAALGFPAIVVASRDDPFVELQRAEHFARCWGARLVDGGAIGHINTDSELGAWRAGHRLLEELCG